MRRIQTWVVAAVALVGFSAAADESVAEKLQRSLDEANETVNRELQKSREKSESSIDEANRKANQELEKARKKIPGVKKLQDATNKK